MLIKSSLKKQAPKPVKSADVDLSQTQKPEENQASPKDGMVLSGDAGQRIGHFVRSVTTESLEHLRYLSAADAFGKIGSTLGSVGLTPLAITLANENAALIGGLAIGGTVAAGALGAVAGFAWLHHQDGKQDKASEYSKLTDTALNIGSALQALPKFVYPTVIGASDAQRELVYNALDQLPLHQATASATIEVVPDLVDTGISGMAQPGSSHVHMLLDQSYVNSASRGTSLVLHEQAHAVDYSGGFGLIGAHNWKGGFGKEPFVSNYATSNRYEDFAESFEEYHLDPEGFSAEFPEKAAAIEEISHPDLISAAADREGVRSAGKKIGTTLGKVPYLRTGLELAGSLVAPMQTHRGASKLIDGLESGDDQMKLEGKLQLASGLFLTLPGARPLGLATSIAGAAIKATAKDEGATLEQANRWADRVLATSAGPVGMTIGALAGELTANGMKLDASQGFGPQGWQSSRPSRGDMLKGTLSTVGGTVGGALAGAALGGALGGRGGAFVGALWGQAAGGMVGLAGYAVHRATKESKDQQNPLALTRGDKRFLRRTVGGAVVGGTAGTLAGAFGGRMAGTAIGNAFGSAAAGSIMGSIGGWVGGLAGAFGGAKLGAGVGSGRLLG